ncbi:MAG: hypothetical protein Q4E86_14435, partial [Lachnospiraceae bacterium]|nr:hypothetical protein [Lachnospiraceae bacterium]
DGIVAEAGTPQELMKEDGVYRRMVKLQKMSGAWTIGGPAGMRKQLIQQAKPLLNDNNSQ